MKATLLTALLLFLFACTNEENTTTRKPAPEPLVEVKNGVFYEWYPGKKQVKFKGSQDENKQRNGIWTFYSERGTELSVTYYVHGVKEGFSIVKYPNGAMHYRGEYHEDKPIGIWTTYAPNGEVSAEKDFGQPKE